MPLIDRVYQFVLRLYPSSFREEYGDEMLLLARDQVRENPVRGLLHACRDLFWHAPREHFSMAVQDLQYAVRSWRRQPAIPITALLALALGTGANTAMFSIIHAVLFRSLPVEDPARLVRVHGMNEKRGFATFSASIPDYLSWKERSKSVELAAFSGTVLNWTGDGDPERLETAAATSSYLSVVGRSVVQGRWFADEEERPGVGSVVLLGERLWRNRFGGQTEVIGRSIILNDRQYEIIGVAPSDLPLDFQPDIWVPLEVDPGASRSNHFIIAMGRVRPGFTIAQAESELKSIAHALEREFPNSNEGWSVRLEPLSDWLVGSQIRSSLILLFLAVGIVAVIMCANVANLLLTRAEARRKEIAIREALGAGVLRLSRQLLTESLALALTGGAIGIGVAYGIVTLIRPFVVDLVPRAEGISVDTTVLAYALGVATVTGMLFGAVPMWRVLRQQRVDALYTAGRTSQAGPGSTLRRLLVAGQVALATLLVIGAGLTIRSLARLQQVPTGFDADHVLTMRLNPPRARYGTGAATASFLTRLSEGIAATPGIQAAGVASAIPLGPGAHGVMKVQTPGLSGSTDRRPNDFEWRLANADFFRALRIPLVHGRLFSGQETDQSPRMFVISRAAATALFGSEQRAVGQSIKLENGMSGEVIGVVGNVPMRSIADPADAVVYMPPSQFGRMPFFALFVRSKHDTATTAAIVKERLKEIDPKLPAYGTREMASWVQGSSVRPRLRTAILSILAFLAVALGFVGIYGVLAYLVGLRKHEFGIRLAVGARPVDVIWLVTKEGLLLAAVGATLGLLIALWLARALETLLFGIATHDALTFTAAPLLLLAAALAASLGPSLRASRLDPSAALRTE